MATRRTTKKPLGSVAFAGVGPGDSSLLTLRAVELIAASDVLITDMTVPESVLEGARPDADVINAEEIDETAVITTAAREARSVLRLCSGDVYLSGSHVATLEALAKAKIAVEVVPGVPTAAAVAACAGLPMSADTAPATFITDVDGVDWETVVSSGGPVALQLPAESFGVAVKSLLAAGARSDLPLAVVAGGATTAQRTVVSTLGEVTAAVKVAKLSGGLVVVLGDVVRKRDRLAWFEQRALFGWTVLVPRTRAQAGEVSTMLRGLGAAPLEVPTIAVEPPRTPAPMERAIRGLVSGRYAWVAFTSTNAVKAVREKLEEIGLDARAFAGVKVAAIGTATAEALLAFGIRPDLVPAAEQSSEGLLKAWPDYDDVFDPLDRVFLPRADIATETLVAGLKDRGWAVDDITAYRTVRATPPPAPVREALKGGRVDAVMFTSSSTVRNLLGIAGKPHDSTVIACIGPQTANTAKELGLRVDVLAPTATVESLTLALAEFAVARRAELAAAPAPAPAARKRSTKR